MIKYRTLAKRAPSCQDAFETKYFLDQLQHLSKTEKTQRVWTWIKQGKITYQQFCAIIDYLGKFEVKG